MSPAIGETSVGLRTFREPETCGADEGVLADPRTEAKGAWQDVVDQKLIEWGRQPGREDDDGLVFPSALAVRKSCHLVDTLQNECPPPLRVVPDGDGGISFEWCQGSVFVSVDVWENGGTQMLCFRDGRLAERTEFSLELRSSPT